MSGKNNPEKNEHPSGTPKWTLKDLRFDENAVLLVLNRDLALEIQAALDAQSKQLTIVDDSHGKPPTNMLCPCRAV